MPLGPSNEHLPSKRNSMHSGVYMWVLSVWGNYHCPLVMGSSKPFRLPRCLGGGSFFEASDLWQKGPRPRVQLGSDYKEKEGLWEVLLIFLLIPVLQGGWVLQRFPESYGEN